MCITVIYIHTYVGLKHYDKFFKYPNSLFVMKYDALFVLYTHTILLSL